MLSIPAKVTLPSVPLPAPLIVRLLAPVSELATLSESVPVLPSTLIVDVEALLTVKASVPPWPLTVSKPLKVVLPPLVPAEVPAPLPDTVMVLLAPSRLRVSVPSPPARLVTLPPSLIVAVSLPAPRSIVSKPLTVRLLSRVVVPLLATESVLTPLVALRLSMSLPPTRLSKPLTAPVMIAVDPMTTPPAAVEVALSRLTVTGLAYPAKVRVSLVPLPKATAPTILEPVLLISKVLAPLPRATSLDI